MSKSNLCRCCGQPLPPQARGGAYLTWRKSQIFDAIAKDPGISIAGLIATVYGGNATAATIKAHVAQANDLLASSSERIARERGRYRIVTTPGASW